MSIGPHIRLAHCPGAQGDNTLIGQRGVPKIPRESAPSLLLSYHYYQACSEVIRKYQYRDWVLDSGAFSAMNSGAAIDLGDYIQFCKEVLDGPTPPVEIFALDVIGDAEASKQNTERMWEAGIEAIPAYHVGEPTRYLKEYADTYPKVALGGVARWKGSKKLEWAGACFGHIWPKKIHGFGFGTEAAILGLPFHSTDSTNWEMGPCAFGRWKSYAGAGGVSTALTVRGSTQDLRVEVEYYLKLEQRARCKWRTQMEEIGSLDEPSPSIRLAIVRKAPPARMRLKPKENPL